MLKAYTSCLLLLALALTGCQNLPPPSRLNTPVPPGFAPSALASPVTTTALTPQAATLAGTAPPTLSPAGAQPSSTAPPASTGVTPPSQATSRTPGPLGTVGGAPAAGTTTAGRTPAAATGVPGSARAQTTPSLAQAPATPTPAQTTRAASAQSQRPTSTARAPTAAPAAAAAAGAPTGRAPTPAPAATASPRILLYASSDALWAAPFDGTPPRQISPDGFFPLPTRPLPFMPAIMSPDARWVIAVSPKDGQGTWLFSVDGSTQRQLSHDRLAVSWAPNSAGYTWADEASVYVSFVTEGSRPLAVAHVDKPAAILPLGVAWSPAGDQIAFQVQENGGKTASVRLVSAAGGPSRSVATGGVRAQEIGSDVIQWAPDAQKLLWTLPTRPQIVFADGRPSVEMPEELVGSFAFAPDSQSLLARWGKGDNHQLASVGLDGKLRQSLATTAGDFTSAAWSPDGTHVAYVLFASKTPGDPRDNQLWTVNADGSGAQRLAEATDLAPFTADWLTPTALVVAGGDEPPNVTLRRVDAKTGSAQTLIKSVGWFFTLAPRR